MIKKTMALNDIQFFFLVVVETIHAKVTRENERTNEKKYPYRENVKREKNAHLYYTMPYDDGMSASMSLPLNRVQRWKYIEQIPCSFARYKWINSRLIFFVPLFVYSLYHVVLLARRNFRHTRTHRYI